MKFNKIKNHLEKRLVLLETHLNKIDRELSNRVVGDGVEVSANVKVINENIVDKIHNEVRLINLALDQMVEGSYGICRYCGKLIAVEQLERFPYSQQCASCRNH